MGTQPIEEPDPTTEGLDEAERDVRIGADETDDVPVDPPAVRPPNTDEPAGESLDDRLAQEVPDPDSGYGPPEDHAGASDVGGDDPDAIDDGTDPLGTTVPAGE